MRAVFAENRIVIYDVMSVSYTHLDVYKRQAMEDAKGGLLVANRGLYEYEILEDQGNAVAVTLLRCVAAVSYTHLA